MDPKPGARTTHLLALRACIDVVDQGVRTVAFALPQLAGARYGPHLLKP